MKPIKTAAFIGSGNVATHLALAMHNAGVSIRQVFSRRIENARRLADALSCNAIDDIEALDPDADIYVLAVADDAIEPLMLSFPFRNRLILHTSGSTDMDVLKSGSDQYGVLYPLQTFSREVPVDFMKVPLCLEVSDTSLCEPLENLANRLSDHVQWVSSEKRRILHLAAVFACNFVNHMYAQAAGIVDNYGLDFAILRPLIEETARKAMKWDPRAVQTGPAKRNDTKIMDTHRRMLKDHPDLKEMYDFISNSILSQKNHNV